MSAPCHMQVNTGGASTNYFQPQFNQTTPKSTSNLRATSAVPATENEMEAGLANGENNDVMDANMNSRFDFDVDLADLNLAPASGNTASLDFNTSEGDLNFDFLL